ncbi:MFS transporter [Curtobacterium sp. VKM Ac-1395]|uniref:MFS transporter n=1 Tax=Curtobacterium sp. VKM Ac-1395 TaxID=2783815 RepID=UPI00188D7D01|nr:MFS transporter [Curtobacterium sp. VKM Ac-1395]MBF4590285.1 MFS transporter [Curtobacterium sp. VKM Ac-1395]
MTTTGSVPVAARRPAPADTRFPLPALVVLAATGFVLIGAETMPAGLLPQIADGLSTSEGTVGLLVSAYALGTVVVTIPAITLTRGIDRKPLLLAGVAALLVANTITAFSDSVTLSLITRFLAGAFSGVLWGMLATYGRRISPPASAGRSLAIVSTGAPVGIAFGTPLGSWLGTTFDWRWSFGGLSIITAVVFALVVLLVPNVPGQAAEQRKPLRQVVRIPGVGMVLAVIAVWMLGHSTAYTYIAPFLRAAGPGVGVDLVLVVFGLASIAGIAVTGALLDRFPQLLLHGTVLVFTVAGVLLLVGNGSTLLVVVAVALWGIAFGGAPAQLQSALTIAGGADADVANSFLPVAFNIAIFGAGILGAGVLAAGGGLAPMGVMVVLGLAALALTVVGRRTAFRPAS